MRAQLKKSWTAAIETAIAEKVDCMVVAGGLFDSSEISRPAVEFVLKEIARLGETPVVVVPGMRDHLGKGSLYYHFDLLDRPENFFPITFPGEALEFKKLNLTVIGCPATGPKSKESPLAGVRAPQEGCSVLIASGHWEGENHPVSESEIGKTGAGYVALGGEAAFKSGVAQKTAYAFSGSPESPDFSVPGPAGVVIVDLDKKPAAVELHPLGVLVWKEETLSDSAGLEKLLEREKGENRLLRVRLSGAGKSTGEEWEEVFTRFREQFLSLEVRDERKPATPQEKFPAHTIAGQFLRLAEESLKKAGPEEKEELAEAIACGLALMASPSARKEKI